MTPQRAPPSVWVSWKRNAASDIPGASVYNRATLVQKLLAVVAASLLMPSLLQQVSAGLSESARLSAVYDTILQARFNQARTEISRSCPPAPPESCLALSAVALWWEIQLDSNNRRLDKSLESASAVAIDATGAERLSAAAMP